MGPPRKGGFEIKARRSEAACAQWPIWRRLATIGVLLAVAIGIVSTLAALAAFGWDFEAPRSPSAWRSKP